MLSTRIERPTMYGVELRAILRKLDTMLGSSERAQQNSATDMLMTLGDAVVKDGVGSFATHLMDIWQAERLEELSGEDQIEILANAHEKFWYRTGGLLAVSTKLHRQTESSKKKIASNALRTLEDLNFRLEVYQFISQKIDSLITHIRNSRCSIKTDEIPILSLA